MSAPKMPTDRALLEMIYSSYYAAFVSDYETREAKPYVAIDIRKIADHFGVYPELIFGQLHYHLQRRFGFKNSDGSEAQFFAIKVGAERHCIQFSMLGAALAEMRAVHTEKTWAFVLSLISIAVAVVALFFSAA